MSDGTTRLWKSHLERTETIHRGVARYAELASKIAQVTKAEKAQPSLKLDAKTDAVVVFYPQDQKDIAAMQSSLDMLRAQIRDFAFGMSFSVIVSDAPQQITSTAGNLLGCTFYFNDVQTNASFANYNAIFDTFRLDSVRTCVGGTGIGTNTLLGVGNVMFGACDVDQTGSTTVGAATPTVATLSGYPLKSKGGSHQFEPKYLGSFNGTDTIFHMNTSAKDIHRGIDGNSSSQTKVPMGTWVNMTGAPTIVVGAHLSAVLVTFTSAIVASYWRNYHVSFSSVKA
jgi:hypothetical protein